MKQYLPVKVMQETKAIIKLYQFLRYECELKEVNRLSAKEFKELLHIIIKNNRKMPASNFLKIETSPFLLNRRRING